jgi:menaquinone-dependent protoporphyrinogen oxidase
MATLILYMTTHGCTEKAVRILMNHLNDDINLVNLEGVADPDLSLYDRVIIGGSIHMGEIQKGLKKYCERNLPELLKKKIGLILCCMFEGDVAKKQFEEAYPEALRNHAAATGLFGGEISFDKMNVLEKLIVKKVAKIDQDVSKLNQLAIKEFAQKISG